MYKNHTCTNLPIILKRYEDLKGQFVITASWNIERLVGIGDDGEDWYYLTYNGRKLIWNTCVVGLMALKGKLKDKDYSELVRTAKLNHYDQFPEMREEHMEELKTMEDKDEIVVGLYMEIV